MRCVACNSVMRPAEIIWYENRKEFESHCSRCKVVEGVKQYLPEYKELEEHESDDDATKEGT